jgi:hypothetical protein
MTNYGAVLGAGIYELLLFSPTGVFGGRVSSSFRR